MPTAEKSEFPFVEVQWMDAACSSDEHDELELPELVQVKTSGYLVKRNEEGIWVAAEVLHESEKSKTTFRSTTVIPMTWVTKIRRIKELVK